MTSSQSNRAIFFCRCNALVWLILLSSCAVAQVSNPGLECSSPEVVLQRYIDAVGGEAALQRIQTRMAEANQSMPATYKPTVLEHFKYRFEWKAPNKVVFRHTDYWFGFAARTFLGANTFKFDGQNWSDFDGTLTRNDDRTPPRQRKLKAEYPMFDGPFHMMARVVADPLMVARSKELYSNFKVSYELKAGSGLCALYASGPDGHTRDTLYFDAQSGLLKTWEIQMPGWRPSGDFYFHFQFDDYRQVGEVTFPYYIYFDFYKATFRFTKVVHNLALADSDFVPKPKKPGAY
jgi:hypothetical protein